MEGDKSLEGLRPILLKNGRVIDPVQNLDRSIDILLSDGKITALGPNLGNREATVIDCSGKWVVPGLIDAHCHLREPGAEQKETIETGTKAAAHGGFTTIIAMANTNPVPDKLNVYNKIQKLITDNAVIRVIQVASVTKDLRGRDLCEMASLAAAGVKIFSDDGMYLSRASVLYQALQLAKKLNVIISLHQEDASLKSYWPTAYEPVNEFSAIARDLEILRVTGGKVHFQHLSTSRSVELIRQAKREGLDVTAEVCPHHLTLTSSDIGIQGTNAKMAPPLRNQEDISELIRGLDDGTIDIIATDHAPHAFDDKNVTYDQAANGIIGLETALPILLTKLVHGRGISPMWLIERMSSKPAKIFDLPGGNLMVGSPADICVIDPLFEWFISKDNFISKSRNTPYNEVQVKGSVLFTIVNGNVVFDGRMPKD